jgi:hypothetical protein
VGRATGGEAVIRARLAATPALNETDGHALAGFLEAESSLALIPSNDRRSWRLACATCQRDDDAEVLADFQRLTGIGSLSRVAASGNSAPQVAWTISSRLECTRLAEILHDYPMRGRKAFEFSIWAAAVDVWSLSPAGRPLDRRLALRLQRAAEQLHFLRRYVDPARHLPRWSVSEPGLVQYIGGFFTGEGSFYLSRKSARMTINLRSDDRPLLELLAAETGLGKIYTTSAWRSSRPASRWIVGSRDQLPAAIALLRRAGLRGRKKREFAAWRAGALEFISAHRQERPRDPATVEESARALLEARRYHRPMPGTIHTGHVGPSTPEVFIEILRAWSDRHTEPLSCTAYMKARCANPDWPSRAAITAAFGSWAGALEAAGLRHRVAISDEVRDRRASAGRAARRQTATARRAAQRETVLTAVRELSRELGHPPRLTEFAQWRTEQCPPLPAVATIYRLFPAGWESVVREAKAAAEG